MKVLSYDFTMFRGNEIFIFSIGRYEYGLGTKVKVSKKLCTSVSRYERYM